MKTIYKAVNNNTDDGRGRDDDPIYFTKQVDAMQAIDGKSAYGANGRITEIKLFESFEESTKAYQEKMIQQALNKLTLEERRALGH